MNACNLHGVPSSSKSRRSRTASSERRSSRSQPERRDERKQRTRQALLDAALALAADRGFGSVSLREVAREAQVVPTAFYRHFASMDELGQALVAQSARALQPISREIRPEQGESAVDHAIDALIQVSRQHRAELGFLAGERYGGVAVIRRAIRTEMRLYAGELTAELARFPELSRLNTQDLRVGAELITTAMTAWLLDVIEAPDAEAEADVAETARTQLRVIFLGLIEMAANSA